MGILNRYGIKSRNIILVYLGTIFAGMLFFAPILALYLEDNLFTLTNVALIFSVKAVAIVLSEYPTGAIADILGRKKAMVLSGLTILVSVIFLFIGGNIGSFILFAILTGFGYSLYSGADSALIYDTLKEERKEKYFKKIIGTKYALWPIGAGIGSLIGGYLATFSLTLPVIMTTIPLSISFLTTLFLIEPKYEKEKNNNLTKHMIFSSKLVLKNYQLIILLISAFILIGIGDVVHYLKPVFFEFKEIPISMFGLLFAISFGLSSVGHYSSHEISEKIGNKPTIIIAAFLLAFFTLFSTFFSSWSAIGVLLLGQIAYGVGRPVTDHLINLETDSKSRATVISSYNFMRHLGNAAFIPLIGFASDLYSINTGYLISAIAMLSVPLMFILLKNK